MCNNNLINLNIGGCETNSPEELAMKKAVEDVQNWHKAHGKP